MRGALWLFGNQKPSLLAIVPVLAVSVASPRPLACQIVGPLAAGPVATVVPSLAGVGAELLRISSIVSLAPAKLASGSRYGVGGAWSPTATSTPHITAGFLYASIVQQSSNQQDAIARAKALLACLSKCDDARKSLIPEIDHLDDCPIGFDASVPAGMAEPDSKKTIEDPPGSGVEREWPAWTEGSPNPLWFNKDFGAGGTHWHSDIFGEGAASDLALAALMVHESSHSLRDNYSGDFSTDPPNFPASAEVAWHQGEVQAAQAQLLILSSLLTVCGDDCLDAQNGRPLTPAERKAIEKEIEVVDDYIKKHSDLEGA